MLTARLTLLVMKLRRCAESVEHLRTLIRDAYDDTSSAFTTAPPWFDPLTLDLAALDALERTPSRELARDAPAADASPLQLVTAARRAAESRAPDLARSTSRARRTGCDRA